MSKTKKSLLLSCLSMLLCVTMLIGSTFAWFTDNASTGLNSIQAGTLDIDVQYTQDGMSWSNLDNATDLFAGALWEPGHTRVVALKVTNNGSLALKYQMGMNIVSETMGTNVYGDPFKLSDYLEVSTLAQQANDSMGVGNITLSVAFQGENAVGYEYTNKLSEVKRENHLLPGDSHYLFIKVDMPETVGNEANAKPGNAASIQFGINILATQFAYESDSFGSSYDAEADFTDVVVVTEATYEAFAEAVASVEDGGTVVLPAGEYTIPANAKGKTLTITGTKDTKIKCIKDGEGDYGLDGATVTFEGVTLDFDEQDYNGYVRAKATYIDCTIYGRITLYGESTFTNCTFNNMEGYNVWTWGSNATFENCTFNSGGKSVLVYGSGTSTVTINNCTFNDYGNFNDKAAIETGSDYGESFTININNVTVNGFDVNPNGISTGSTIWANKNSMPTDRLNVVIDGVDVY